MAELSSVSSVSDNTFWKPGKFVTNVAVLSAVPELI